MNISNFKKAVKSTLGYDLGRKVRGTLLFDIKNKPNQVIKFSFLEYHDEPMENQLARVISLVKKKKTQAVVDVLDYGQISYGIINYNFYVMKKLNKMPAKTGTIIVTALCDFYKDKCFIPPKAPIFLEPKFRNFIDQANKFPLVYNDLHSGNIMLDRKGNYKFVDLESFYMYKSTD